MPDTKYFASATGRTASWNGIQQNVTERIRRKLAYELTGMVRIFGNGNVNSADVIATLWIQTMDGRDRKVTIAREKVTEQGWVQLKGKFSIYCSPLKVMIYLEGPPQGVDILLNSLSVKHVPKDPPCQRPFIEDASYGINIIANGNFTDGITNWSSIGHNCTLRVERGSPRILPPMAIESLELYEPLSGFYIHVSARTETYHGPCQFITEKVKLYLTYQVSAWVRIGTGATTPQKVNVKLQVDEDRWVNAAEVEIDDNEWHELGGSFRIEQPVERRVMVYVEGPSPGIDLMVGGLQIFPVHRHMRIPHLRKQTDEVQKRDVILKFSGFSSGENENDIYVKIKQTENSFPIGSCLNRNDIDNEDLVDFFLKHFNWAVFENELKWNWIQETKKKLNYREADELLGFCTKNNIPVRGHCLFWEVEKEIQDWVCKLPSNELERAVQDRLKGLLKRYEGRFKHYDVNNEMMHGSFYQEKLGEDFRATMFKNAQKLDKNAVLFVNDYHIEDGYDGTSSPQKYVDHVRDLQKQGAPVGGVGIQGHAESPVGPIICSALNKLKILKLPIWFTEIDVSSDNEFVRADDLEVMLREAFAHPSVEGIMLWGFWELSMFRKNSHLVDAEGDINEAGKRFLTLKKEWLSEAHGYVDNHGHFDFRGFLGSYQVEVQTQTRKVTKTFVVGKDQGPQIISLALQ